MTIKPFAIQGTELTLGGINLQAGATGVVIPGITQATNYFVEEVNDTDIDQTVQFVQLSIVVDAATYNALSTNASTATYSRYNVELDDDSYINEITVATRGTYTQQEKTTNETADMWAYTGLVDPFTTPFDQFDWLQVPFRPKMRADEIQTIGGGGGIGNLGIGDNDESINSDNGLSFIDFNENGDDNLVLGTNSSNNSVKVSLNEGAHEFTFNSDGSLTFPDGSIQTTAYTGQSGGGGSVTGNIYIMANTDGNIVTSTDGVTWGQPIPSGMAGISRVAVHNGTIVYACEEGTDAPGGSGPIPGIYYSTTIGTVNLCAGTNTFEESNLFWTQVRYFSEPNKWVAVGYNDGTSYQFPAVAHSDDGINWTVVLADNTFVTGFNDEPYDWPLTDVAWISDTQQYIITSKINGPSWYGGVFVTSDITVALDASVHVAIELNSRKVAPWVVTQYGGPPGYVILFEDGDTYNTWYGFGNVTSNYGLDSEILRDSIRSQIGYLPQISEVAYDSDGWIALTRDGQAFVPIITMGPSGYNVSVPLAYTTTDFSITNANPAVLSYSGQGPLALKNNEKIVISGSGEYNGTYYWSSIDGVLFTDQALENIFDASGLSAFASGGTLTMSHGQYFDAAGTAAGYYYIGNDDEQVFRSADGTNWTQLADVDGQYFNDFAYGTFGTVDTGVSFVQLADGSLQAQAAGLEVASLSSSLTASKPSWLTVTPRSLDRSIIDFQYGFDGNGMWFTGNNEETLQDQPAYPIHTTASFPADSQVVVEFDISLVSGEEDWGVCVYPADGVPHWAWNPHPSRIAAMVDCSIGEGPYIRTRIHGLTDSSQGSETSDVARARFTYNPLAEMTILEVLNVDGGLTSRTELPGRLAKGQDYMIGFDGDWDDAGIGDKSYFSNLSITVGDTGVTKTTEFSLNGAVKLPSTVKGFINVQGPWINSDNNFQYQTVTTHDGFAYMGGESNWGSNENVRIDKYSLTTGELVWSRSIGAGRDASFDISWTGGVFTLTSIANGGFGYQVGQILTIIGYAFSGDYFLNRATITVTAVTDTGGISTATISGTAPSGTSSTSGVTEEYPNADGGSTSIKYDTVNDEVVMLNYQFSGAGDVEDGSWDRAVVLRINPVSGDVASHVTLTDQGDIYPWDVALHPTTGATAVVGEKMNEFRSFGTLTMLKKANGYFDILKSNLDAEYWPGNTAVVPALSNYDFWIQGTGITTRYSVTAANAYDALPCTTRQGYGALLSIATNGDGTYSFAYASPTGYNYRPGHKIKILGTSLGGATPANDAIVTINSVDEEGGVGSASITGTSANTSGTPFAYENVSGTNYNVGSGLTIDINVDPVTGSRIAYINQTGSNYVDGDVAIIAGTQFANGATPANDVEVTIVSVVNSGNANSVVTAGTTPINAIRIAVEGVDFTAGGEVTARANWNGQGGWNQGSYINLATTGGTGTGLTVDVAAGGGGYINLSAITINNPGKGYTTGDVITINNENNLPGTFTITANAQGSWTMKQNLGGEAFVWTADWDKAIGGPSGDRFQAVTYSKDGASIYAVGDGQYDVNFRQSLVVKYATSDGTIGFSKYLNSDDGNAYATSVATIGASDIVVSGYENIGNNQNKMFVARLNSGGTILWKKFYYNTYSNYNSLERNNNVVVDSNDNIYVTLQHAADNSNSDFQQSGLTVVKLDNLGNKLWSRCVNAQNNNSYLGTFNGNRWSSLDGNQLIVAGYTYVTANDYYSGLWASFPTDGFTYFGGENEFVQQGAFRFSQGAIFDGELSQGAGGNFTPSVQPPTITAVNNLKKYETRTTIALPQHLHKIVDTKTGGLVFGDGTKQTTAADRVPQIKIDRDYMITANDSGKHIYFRNNSGTVTIPTWWSVKLPVGFTFTIVNRTGDTCYVNLEWFPGEVGRIHGAGRNISTPVWGIPDSGSGSMVTLIKLEDGHDYNAGGQQDGQVWMISGPGDIYDAD